MRHGARGANRTPARPRRPISIRRPGRAVGASRRDLGLVALALRRRLRRSPSSGSRPAVFSGDEHAVPRVLELAGGARPKTALANAGFRSRAGRRARQPDDTARQRSCGRIRRRAWSRRPTRSCSWCRAAGPAPVTVPDVIGLAAALRGEGGRRGRRIRVGTVDTVRGGPEAEPGMRHRHAALAGQRARRGARGSTCVVSGPAGEAGL